MIWLLYYAIGGDTDGFIRVPGEEKLVPIPEEVTNLFGHRKLEYMRYIHEYVYPPQTASTCLNPRTSKKISTPRYCVSSSTSFRADVGLRAFAYCTARDAGGVAGKSNHEGALPPS